MRPARKYWGRKTKLKIWFAALVSDIVFSRSRPKAPPMKHESSATGTSRATCNGVSGNSEQQCEEHERDHLHDGDEGLTRDLAEHDRVARHGRDEDLLREIVLAVLHEGRQALGRGLEKRHAEEAGEGEADKVEARRLAQVQLERAPEQEDHHEGKDDRSHQTAGIANELQQVAPRNGGDGVQLRHLRPPVDADRRPLALPTLSAAWSTAARPTAQPRTRCVHG